MERGVGMDDRIPPILTIPMTTTATTDGTTEGKDDEGNYDIDEAWTQQSKV